MQKPNVVTTLRDEKRNFTLYVTAYRTLTKSELLQTLAQWMKNKRLKTLPRNGTGKAITLHGFDE